MLSAIRSLSLENKLLNTNTIKRITRLNEKGVIENELASELIMAFNFLTNINLKSNLEKLDKQEEVDNYINPNSLNTMEKDNNLFDIGYKYTDDINNNYKNHLIFFEILTTLKLQNEFLIDTEKNIYEDSGVISINEVN